MKLFIYIFVLFQLINFSNVFAQDTIWFLSGERLITSNYTIKVEDGMLSYFNKHNKEKKVGIEYVFSIIEKSGKEKIFYEPVSMDNTPFTVDQMRSFMYGEFEASEHFHAVGSSLTGFVSGFGGFYLFPLVLKTTIFYSPLLPAVGSAVTGMINISDKKIIKNHPKYANDEFFISGYIEIAKQKRVSHSIMGGIIGLAVGVASAMIINNLK